MSAEPTTSTTTLPGLVVYGDLACPYSALASYRASWLEATGRARIEFRIVESPDRPRGVPVEGELRDRLRDEVEEVQHVLVEGPVFPICVPAYVPDTTEALGRQAFQAPTGRRSREFRVRLFRAIWLRGIDISTASALEAVGVLGPTDFEAADRWHQAWTASSTPTVPMVVTSDGAVHRNREALDLLLSLRSPGTRLTQTHK